MRATAAILIISLALVLTHGPLWAKEKLVVKATAAQTAETGDSRVIAIYSVKEPKYESTGDAMWLAGDHEVTRPFLYDTVEEALADANKISWPSKNLLGLYRLGFPIPIKRVKEKKVQEQRIERKEWVEERWVAQ